MKRKTMYIFPLLVLLFCTAIYAHDNISIHPAITEIAVGKSNIDQYLKDNLNLKDGLKTTLQPVENQTVLYLLSKGSTAEDSPMCRASNHFHDPLKSWDVSGRSDNSFVIGLINQYCNLQSWPSPYYSDITWSTGLTAPISTPIPYNPDNDKSPNMWGNARTLYYNALTATNQTTRENNFAQMFKALGQVMHLLQGVAS